MITSNYQVDGDIYSYADKFFCDSSDDKPSNADAKDGLINGAILEETDTGKTYIFDKKANKWAEKSAGGGTGGSSTLSGLTDVDISTPSNGQTLVYNARSDKWENGAGGSSVPDVVIEATGDDAWTADGSYTLVSGTYAALKAKIVEHKPFNVLLVCHSSDEGGYDDYSVFIAQSAAFGTENDGATDLEIGLLFSTFHNSGVFLILYFYPDGHITTNPDE